MGHMEREVAEYLVGYQTSQTSKTLLYVTQKAAVASLGDTCSGTRPFWRVVSAYCTDLKRDKIQKQKIY